MDALRVRCYNVRFGDAVLVSIPDRTASGNPITRHILIDVGNVLLGAGGQDALFTPVIQDIQDQLHGRPLDLYIMTHEHLDHIQGLPYAHAQLGVTLRARHAWLTASAEPNYYDRHPEARRRLDALRQAYAQITRFLSASPSLLSPALQAVLKNNDPRRTAECVDYLRSVGRRTWYVYQGFDASRRPALRDARLEIWAPEKDASIYYTPVLPMALNAPADLSFALDTFSPPAGVDAGTFYNLVEMRRRGFMDNLLAIDRAANNTSIVFSLEWHGWRLLFAGDAEIRSWQTIYQKRLLRPVHFLKVSHHGSFNGLPPAPILDAILPLPAPDGRPRHALVSTFPGTYNNIPDDAVLNELAARCTLHSTQEVPDGAFLDILFPP